MIRDSDRGAARMPAPRIVWYFDVISPFAYLALPAVAALARRHTVLMRPIVLAAVLARWGQRGPAEIVPKRLHTYRLCQFMAERAGQTMRFPPRHPFRSLDALRLLAALDCDPAAIAARFAFVWGEGRDPSEPGERATLCERLGVTEYETFIAARDAKAKLRAYTEDAIAAAVFGVPTLAIGQELFWGVDAMPMAEAYLDAPDMLDHGEMARIATLPIGVARDAT